MSAMSGTWIKDGPHKWGYYDRGLFRGGVMRHEGGAMRGVWSWWTLSEDGRAASWLDATRTVEIKLGLRGEFAAYEQESPWRHGERQRTEVAQ